MKFNNKTIQIILLILGVFLLLILTPGEGKKAADANIRTTNYTCSAASDCPSCISDIAGGSSSVCSNNVCQIQDTCLIWDCNNASGCTSIRQSLLDNTIQFFNAHMAILFLLIGVVAVWIILALDQR